MIKSFIAGGLVKDQLDRIFNNKISCTAFKESLWIAGGFAREVCHANFNLNDKDKNFKHSRIIDYLVEKNSSGDIDFFCKSEDVCNNVVKKMSEYINQLRDCYSIDYYSTNFSWNYRTYNNYSRLMKSDLMTDVKIQIVNKFFFKNISDCFDSFDVVNCKYALEKNNDDYIIYYEEDALESDREKILKLSSSKSPFTISRVVKYLRHRNLNNISRDEKTQKIFLECLYKTIENNWPEIYNINEESIKSNIKNLHKTIKLSPELLSMFIGFMKETIIEGQEMVRPSSGYGIYFSNVYKDIDWASKELMNTCNL